MSNTIKTFLVGGAVRDRLMGRIPKDIDFVVVGASVSEMVALGFKSVGKDFPVFLHPESGDEYALARTERKTGVGYHGFDVNVANTVTLEEDLARRDLTINAMAMEDDGTLIDPYGGQKDLQDGVLRHVSNSFAEDPVRVLRIARFAARYKGFVVAEETMELMRSMVSAGEVDHLVAERVWQEIAKGLMEDQPARMLEVLRECGALAKLMPELDALAGVEQPVKHHPEVDCFVHVCMVIDQAAKANASLAVRFAALMHDLGKGVTPAHILPSHHGHEKAGIDKVKAVCSRLKVPAECKELALMACEFHTHTHRAMEMKASSLVETMRKLDAFRRPDRFAEFLKVCAFDARGRLHHEDDAYPQEEYMETALAAAKTVDVAKVVASVSDFRYLAERIHAARTSAVKAVISKV
jgi:tRNA nucleotidyltransferase (CCA-adding enzyme)